MSLKSSETIGNYFENPEITETGSGMIFEEKDLEEMLDLILKVYQIKYSEQAKEKYGDSINYFFDNKAEKVMDSLWDEEYKQKLLKAMKNWEEISFVNWFFKTDAHNWVKFLLKKVWNNYKLETTGSSYLMTMLLWIKSELFNNSDWKELFWEDYKKLENLKSFLEEKDIKWIKYSIIASSKSNEGIDNGEVTIKLKELVEQLFPDFSIESIEIKSDIDDEDENSHSFVFIMNKEWERFNLKINITWYKKLDNLQNNFNNVVWSYIQKKDYSVIFFPPEKEGNNINEDVEDILGVPEYIQSEYLPIKIVLNIKSDKIISSKQKNLLNDSISEIVV